MPSKSPARRPRTRELTGIREVARLAGVSLGTVSNVINHPDKVSEGTRLHVLAVIGRLDFVPNRGAADLRRGRSRMLGLVVPDITNPFFAEVSRGAVDAAAESGYVAVLCNSDVDPDKEDASLELLEEQRVAGVLITPVARLSPRLERLRARHSGIVLVDRSAKATEYCSVSVDDVAGGDIATTHLLRPEATATRTGRRIVLVNGPVSTRQCADRRKGARRAVARAGLAATEFVEISVPAMTVADGMTACAEILAKGPRPTGVLCANDLLAIGVLRVLTAGGIRVPDDIQVIGYDDIERARDLPIPLTSISQPNYDLGHRAAELLVDEIEQGARHRHERVVFQPTLVARQSTDPDLR